MVPIDRAAELGKAIIAASEGRTFGRQPEWWAEFEEQYEPFQARDKNLDADQTFPQAGFGNDCGGVVGT